MLDADMEQLQPVPGTSRIPRMNLHAEVLSVLRDAIVEGRLKPGERLNERLLCEQYGISRTPLREAFKVLAAEGEITLLPNRGAVVTTLTQSDFDATLEVMAHLELLIGELAAENISDPGLDRVRAWHHEMFAHYLRGEIAPYFRLNQQIHLELAGCTGNATLSALYAGLNNKMRRYRFQANQRSGRWRAAIEEHEEILGALIRRDGPRLGALLRQHLLNKGASIRDSVADLSRVETTRSPDEQPLAEGSRSL